jgi:hypothetical protein
MAEGSSHNPVVCILCGRGGSSKCPYCRSVFPEGQSLSEQLLSSMLTIKDTSEHRFPLLQVTIEIRPSWVAGAAETPEDKSLRDIYNVLTEYYKLSADERIPAKQLACRHQWEMLPGFRCKGGCRYVEKATDDTKKRKAEEEPSKD